MSAGKRKLKDDLGNEPQSEEENAYLLTYTSHLEKRLRSLELIKNKMEGELMSVRKELANLQSETKRLRQTPLITGVITDILDNNRVIIKSSSGPSFVVPVSSEIDFSSLQAGMRVALNQRSFGVVEVLPENVDPLVQVMEMREEPPDITYEMIGGLTEQLQEIRETVELPILKPDLFDRIGVEPPKGILLFGPPGTGKTLVAKAVAHATKATFIRIIASELVQKFIGEGARLVREIFLLAKKKAPALIFIDELDAIGSKRIQVATSGDREVQRTLMQLLSELDGFNPRGNVRILAATNRPDILDPALLRPGRFDRLIEFPLPNEEARDQIFHILTRKMSLDNIDFRKLVMATEGATGAEIKAIVTEAGMFAIRRDAYKITMNDFNEAIQKVMKSRKSSKEKFDLYA